MNYQSFDDILRDRRLRFHVEGDASHDNVRRAIETRLTELQAETVAETPEEYRLLMEARQFLEQREPSAASATTALVRLPAATLEKVIEALADRRSEATTPPTKSAEARMVEHSGAAVTQASQDFRHARTWPLAGLGTVSAAILGSRSALAVDLRGAERGVWAAGAMFALVLAFILLLVARRHQADDEITLRRWYDPDIQATAVHVLFFDQQQTQFTRSQYRTELADVVAQRHHHYYHRRLGVSLSTVNLGHALEDAAALALERLVALGVLSPYLSGGLEVFVRGPALATPAGDHLDGKSV